MKPFRLFRSVLTVGGWTLMSRVLGFVRDMMLAATLGPGVYMDAFVAAFRLPNMFRRFFAEGAFNAAFVPMFSKRLEAGDKPDEFASLAFSGLALVLLFFSALAMLFMPALVWATAGGFYGDPRFDLTVGYGRVVFPYILFISLAALFSGALNAAGRFTAAAAAPVLLNILLVAAMTGAVSLGQSVITAIIWTIPVAGVAQMALVWEAARRSGLRIGFVRPRWTPEMARLVTIAVPAALAGGVIQINLVVGQLVASRFENAVSWLYAADRLYQLPLGVVGIAVGIVLLPDLSRRLKAGDDSGAKESFSRAGEIALALTIPCAVALVVIPVPLVSVLFERGAFQADDTAATALATAIYGLGLPAFVLQKLLQPLYFAREDTRSPFHFALVAMILNAAVAIAGAPLIGWIAPAIATTGSAWAMVWLLSRGARQYGDVARFDQRFRHKIWRIFAASALMGFCLWGGEWLLETYLMRHGYRVFALAVLVAGGGVSYLAGSWLFGAVTMSDLRTLRRKRSSEKER